MQLRNWKLCFGNAINVTCLMRDFCHSTIMRVIPRKHIERAFVYAYVTCVVIASLATVNERSQWSHELWQLQPALGMAATSVSIIAPLACLGLVVFAVVALIHAFQQRSSWPAKAICVALILCTLLVMLPAIQ